MTAPTDHPTPGSVLTEADVAAGWKLHDGGPNPVGVQPVNYRVRSGSTCALPQTVPADHLRGWLHTGFSNDIIAYRLSRPQPEPVGSEGKGERVLYGLGLVAEEECDEVAAAYYAKQAILALKAQAAEIKALKEGLRDTRWYVNDHQEAQPNDETRALLNKIDAVLS